MGLEGVGSGQDQQALKAATDNAVQAMQQRAMGEASAPTRSRLMLARTSSSSCSPTTNVDHPGFQLDADRPADLAANRTGS